MVISKKEFIVLMAMLMSFTALTIDAILPALSHMRIDLNLVVDNHIQYVISSVFMGLMVGQIIFGPLSDKIGRKPGLYIGIAVFIAGTLLSLISSSFELVILGRFLQGIGAASTRIISVAIVRDFYSGRDMARIMSFIMAVFIFVPVIAPLVGEGILMVSQWRMIFTFYLVCSLIILAWVMLRLPETTKLNAPDVSQNSNVWSSLIFVLKDRQTMGYAVASGVIFGAFIGYLNSAQQIFQEFFSVGQLFSICFGISAFSVGVAALVNGLTVKRFGPRRTCSLAMVGILICSAVFILGYDLSQPQGLFYPYMIYASVVFFLYGFLFGNFNALAMEPMGEHTGMASSVVGSLSTAIALVVGTVIGQAYDMSLWPLIVGFGLSGGIALIIHLYLVKQHQGSWF